MPADRLKLPEDHGDWGGPYEQADFFDLDRTSIPLRGKEPSTALVEVVRELISIEGPIHEDVFFRHFREALRLTSFPARPRDLVRSALEQLAENGEITQHNAFLDQAGRPCRVARWQVPNAVERPLEHVATEERQVALLGLIGESPGISHDEAIVEAAGFFGWSPRARAPKSAFLGDLYRLRDQQKITGWPDSLHVAAGQGPETTPKTRNGKPTAI